MNKLEAPFFLALKQKRGLNDTIWHIRAPLGKNQIGKFLSIATKNVGLEQVSGAKVTNHSVRKTSISRLLHAEIPESAPRVYIRINLREKNNKGKCLSCSIEFQKIFCRPVAISP